MAVDDVGNVNVGYVLTTYGAITVEVKNVNVRGTNVALAVAVCVNVSCKLALLFCVGTGSDLPVVGVVRSPGVSKGVLVSEFKVTNVTLAVFVCVGMVSDVSFQLCVLAGSCMPVLCGVGRPLVTVGVLTGFVLGLLFLAKKLVDYVTRSKGKNHRKNAKER